jgi:hypothetical protein
MQMMSIKDLHPTQIAVGYQQVKVKKEKLASLKHTELKKYLKAHPVPVVKGHGGYFMIDHHHLCLAAHKLGIKEVYTDMHANLSHLSEVDFWKMMQDLNYIWLYDEQGTPIPFSDLPQHLPPCVEGLKNDPYRSLAGLVRNQGGYDKVDIPYSEFIWAIYFRRSHLVLLQNAVHIPEEIVTQALQLCKDGLAIGLPGYRDIIEAEEKFILTQKCLHF